MRSNLGGIRIRVFCDQVTSLGLIRVGRGKGRCWMITVLGYGCVEWWLCWLMIGVLELCGEYGSSDCWRTSNVGWALCWVRGKLANQFTATSLRADVVRYGAGAICIFGPADLGIVRLSQHAIH